MAQLDPVPLDIDMTPLVHQLGVLASAAESIAQALRIAQLELMPDTQPISPLPPPSVNIPGDVPWNWQCHHDACGFVSSTLGQARAHLASHG